MSSSQNDEEKERVDIQNTPGTTCTWEGGAAVIAVAVAVMENGYERE